MRTRLPIGLLVAALLPSTGTAAVFTAGPHGAHASIQAAIDAALAAGAGAHEVRVEQGTYDARLALTPGFEAHLTISGGWDPAFSARDADPATTVVDAGGLGRAFSAEHIAGGALVLRGLTFRHGTATDGSGLRLGLRGTATAELHELAILENVASNPAGNARGGGLLATLEELARLTVAGCVLRENVLSSESQTGGGGAYIVATGASDVDFSGNEVRANVATGSYPDSDSGGVALFLFDAATAAFTDNLIIGNVAADFAGGTIAHVAIGATPTGQMQVRRNRWIDNDGTGGGGAQLFIESSGTAILRWTDDLLAGGVTGAFAGALDDSALHASNLTVTDHPEGQGLAIFRGAGGVSLGGDVTIYNSIFSGNGIDTDFPAFVEQGSNLVGGDPRFVNAAAGDYRLRADSPAVDAGLLSPPGGLGATDLTGGPRVVGAAPDMGAYELDEAVTPPPPPGPFITDSEVPGFLFKVRITAGGSVLAGAHEGDCIAETVCFSGALPGRTEVFVRIVGPKPNGHLWPTLVKFTTSQVEVWIEQVATGALRYYKLRGAAPGVDELPGLFDREGFLPP